MILKIVIYRYCQIIVTFIIRYVKKIKYFLNQFTLFLVLTSEVINIVFSGIKMIIYVFWYYF